MASYKLYPYQEEGVRFLCSRKRAYLADDPGLGKTLQCYTAIRCLGLSQVLWVCPPNLIGQFRTSSAEFFGADNPVTVLPWTQVHAHDQSYDLVVLDEAHYGKARGSKRSQAVWKGPLLRKAGRIWLLSGTPVMTRPADLYPPLCALWPESIPEYRRWFDFERRFCGGQPNGSSNLDDLAARIQPFFLRRELSVLGGILPPVFERICWIQEPGEPGSLGSIERNNVLATARRLVSSEKVTPELIELICYLLQINTKVLIFCWYTHTMKKIANTFPLVFPTGGSAYSTSPRIFILDGKSTQKQKEAIRHEFCTVGGQALLLCQPVVAGQGLDGLQAVCSTALFVDLDWSPGVIQQSIGRLHRLGQRQTFVRVFYALCAASGLDMAVFRSLRRKQGVISAILQDYEVIKYLK